MSETEALEIIIEQFTGEAGILSRLRVGLGLDERANVRVFEALSVLRGAWRARLRIPKRAVQAFVHVDDAFFEIGNQYEDLDLSLLQMNLTERIEKCLTPDPMIVNNYERALARLVPGSPSERIYNAWMDEKGLLMALHEGKGLHVLQVADLFDAISNFGASYRDTDEIPRIIAYPLATFSGYIASRWGIYWHRPEVQEQILALAEDLRKHIIRSIDDDSPAILQQMKLDLSN
jgi:hypothetical protein